MLGDKKADKNWKREQDKKIKRIGNKKIRSGWKESEYTVKKVSDFPVPSRGCQ
jgi:hypothetical protein